MQDKKYSVQFTVSDWQKLINGLGLAPFNEVNGLINDIAMQVQTQQDAERQPEPPQDSAGKKDK